MTLDRAIDAPPPSALPADWPLLWAEILRVRTEQSARVPMGEGAPTLARREPATGWSLQGGWSEGSTTLFALYQPLLEAATAGNPWCIAQLGQSLDGCVATRSGDSYFVTGPQSLLHLHRLRALCDAVLVGAGTVAVDNPQLTTRRVPGPQPMRVVLDPAARLDGRSGVLRDGLAPTLWLCDARHRDAAQARLVDSAHPPVSAAAASGARAAAGVAAEVLGLHGLLDTSGGVEPGVVMAALATLGLHRVFIEGGGVTVSRFVAAGCVDQLHLVIAPVLIGTGRPGLQLPPWAAMSDCPRPPARVVALGDDRVWDLDLRAVRTRLTPAHDGVSRDV